MKQNKLIIQTKYTYGNNYFITSRKRSEVLGLYNYCKDMGINNLSYLNFEDFYDYLNKEENGIKKMIIYYKSFNSIKITRLYTDLEYSNQKFTTKEFIEAFNAYKKGDYEVV